MTNSSENLTQLTISDLENLIEQVVRRVLSQTKQPDNQNTVLNNDLNTENQTTLTSTERVENWLNFLASLPKTSANLPDEALHRDSMYDY
jgi:hypothetical protein